MESIRAWLRGVGWLCAVQRADGSWPDFLVSPTTEGREWTTAYVAAHLGEFTVRPETADAIHSARRRALRFLQNSARPNGGWGFCATSPVDADSTAWGLLAFPAAEDGTASTVDQARGVLRRHFRGEDGGFGTYRREVFADYPVTSGYYASTPCVTAAAGLALGGTDGRSDGALLEGAVQFLRNRQEPRGNWRSYWWEDGIYTTAIVVRFLRREGVAPQDLAAAVPWLRGLQSADGSWPSRRAAAPSAFHTALAVRALLDLGVHAETDGIVSALEFLRRTQREDGSWDSPPVMCVPRPGDPERPDADPLGTVVPGHRRHFVTATVLGALGHVLAEPGADEGPAGAPAARAAIGPAINAGTGASHGHFKPDLELSDPTLTREIEFVFEEFGREIAALPEPLRRLAGTPAWKSRGAGLGLYLPFWLDAAMGGGQHAREAARMALANRFGQFFCLIQDGVIDRHQGTDARVLLPVDALLVRFVRGYHALFAAESPFWRRFEGYWDEYLAALAWEKERYREPAEFTPMDFEQVGRKYSPLKICAAGMAQITAREESLPAIERALETLQVGYQILDDLDDADTDLSQGNWTWPLVLARQQAHGPLVPEALLSLLRGPQVVLPALDKARASFEASLSLWKMLGLDRLAEWIGSLIREIDATAGQCRSSPPRSQPLAAELKVFAGGREALLYNISTGVVFRIDPELASRAPALQAQSEATLSLEDQLLRRELEAAGVFGRRTAPRASHSTVSIVYMDPGASFRHRCFSCMPDLPADSRGHGAPTNLRRAEVARFLEGLPPAGETETCLDLVLTVSAAVPDRETLPDWLREVRETLASRRKNLRLHVVAAEDTEFPVLNALHAQSHLTVLRVDSVADLQGVDGLVQTACRLRSGGPAPIGAAIGLRDFRGSLTELLTRLHHGRLRPISIQSARTPCPDPGQAPANRWLMAVDYEELAECVAQSVVAGDPIPLVDVWSPLMQVFRCEHVLAHCGAGTTALAIDHAHQIFPCHRFSGLPALGAGDLAPGKIPEVPRSIAQRSPAIEVEACRQCWARHLCGGGCMDNHLRGLGTIDQPDPVECDAIRHRYETAIRLVDRLHQPLATLGDVVPAHLLPAFRPAPAMAAGGFATARGRHER